MNHLPDSHRVTEHVDILLMLQTGQPCILKQYPQYIYKITDPTPPMCPALFYKERDCTPVLSGGQRDV